VSTAKHQEASSTDSSGKGNRRELSGRPQLPDQPSQRMNSECRKNPESGKRVKGVIEDSCLHLNAPENAVSSHKVSISIEHSASTISVEIEGMSRGLILVTGSTISILQPGVSRSEVHVTALEPYGVTGDFLDLRGQQSVTFRLNGREFTHSFLVCLFPTKAAGLLGTNYLERLGTIVDFECGELSLTGVDKMSRVCSISVESHAALTGFPEGKAGLNPRPTKQEARTNVRTAPSKPLL